MKRWLSGIGCLLMVGWSFGEKPTMDANGISFALREERIRLFYPQLDLNTGNDRIAPTDVVLSERNGRTCAELTYPHQGKMVFELFPDRFQFHFIRVPDNLKSYRLEFHLPLALADRQATWRIGEARGAFPKAYGKTKLFQRNAGDLVLSSGGETLAFLFPETYAWVELQDYREWKTDLYGYTSVTPFNPDKKIMVIPFGPDPARLPRIRETAQRAFLTDNAQTQPPKPPARDLAVSLAGDGIHLSCGEMGTFTLSYPLVNVDGADRTKPHETRITGNTATVTYTNGGQLTVTRSAREVRFSWTQSPTGIKGLLHEMFIPFRYNQGGTWRSDAAEGAYPAIKGNAKLFQGLSDTFSVSDANGAKLTLTFSVKPFLEVQDNREWNWSIFWTGFHMPATCREWQVSFDLDMTGYAERKLLDRFGQVERDFPGKIREEAELKADIADETAFYAHLDFAGKLAKAGMRLDRYGGLETERLTLRKTGFFHVEKVKTGGTERWFLADPLGNPFFHLGVCCFAPGDDFTDVTGRTGAFTWLPPHEGPFAAAWKDRPGEWWNSRAVSFYKANVIRKFGAYDEDAQTARFVNRVRAAGFNSIGAFSPVREVSRRMDFPYVLTLPLGQPKAIPAIRGMFDPYDPMSVEAVTQALKTIRSRADDPLLIGYFLANEQALEEIPRALPALDSSFAAKRTFVADLRKKYGTIARFNAAWGCDAPSFDALADRKLTAATPEAAADAREAAGRFLETYYALIASHFRANDPNHLLIGNRWQPVTANDEQLCRIAGKHLDVISINYYTTALDLDFVRRVYAWSGGKPQFWSEFYYTATRESNAGPSSHNLTTQRERGMAYRNYVEGAAALGFVTGIEWFTLIDQAATGRFFEGVNGERANTGLLSVTDRPYRDLLEEMTDAHLDLYPVWLGIRKPWRFDNPAFKTKGE
ncbi:MAG: hypothetical protein J6334_03470 [Kiritimatiellae bacterium]|nr:hypothetical protein [Kiritimatiellia bacterium]